MKILRVFPRRTRATPDDPDVRIGAPILFDSFDYDEIHISVTFTWDLPIAENLVKQWEPYGAVKIGGPATNMRGEEFTPGLYLSPAYVITSRGCPNRCPYCLVPKREGPLRELAIKRGHNVLDDNLLACSIDHIKSVFAMLEQEKRRSKCRIEFTGGLEAGRLTKEIADDLYALRPKQIFFAADSDKKLEPLRSASSLLQCAGFRPTSKVMRCYVMIAYPGDTPERARARLEQVVSLGFAPMAMFYRGEDIEFRSNTKEWQGLTYFYNRPANIKFR